MTESQYRYRVAIVILFANIFVFLLIIILYAFGGFTPDDLAELFKFLLPIKSTYMTLLIKYIIANKNETTDTIGTLRISKLYTLVTSIIIICNIIFISIAIVLAAFNILIDNIDSLKTSIAVIETMFGAYVGIILSDLFKIDGKNLQT
ncbi:MAG: hypothetical protein D3911_03955 [Candidatus Electrothrix sp. AW3_4]|nr:hypothetical protein [Candidatus Electrothrix gigas]